MADEKKSIHCLHVCGHIEAMMEESVEKKFEEKMMARKPISCSTAENSEQLHELYKDKVKGTEPSAEKIKMMKELMEAIEHAKLVHSMTLLRAKQEESGLKRHPSTLSHMHHDDSDSEPEIEEFSPKVTSSTQQTAENLTTDQSAENRTTDPVETNTVDTAAVSNDDEAPQHIPTVVLTDTTCDENSNDK